MEPREELEHLRWTDAPAADESVSVILKVVGERCNLDCAYCYEHRRPYSGERTLSPEMVERFLQWIGPRPLTVELHGGEPLLLPLERLSDLVRVLQCHSSPVQLRIQTNGTLLDAERAAFLASLGRCVQVGVSFDGPGALNHFRWDYAGKSSASRVIQGLRSLDDAGVAYGLIAVAHRRSLDRAVDLVRFVASTQSRVLKIAPCFDLGVRQGAGPVRSGRTTELASAAMGEAMPWAIYPSEYTRFLEDVWRAWKEGEHFRSFLLEPHTTILRRLSSRPVADCHFTSRKCSSVLTLYPDGRVGSCDELDRETAFLGQLEDAALPAYEELWSTGPLRTEILGLEVPCQTCSHLDTCGGGCPATRLRLAALGRQEEYCDHRKAIIDAMAAEIHAR